jgi:hypothetical protein
MELNENKGIYSGCTAIAAFLRTEKGDTIVNIDHQKEEGAKVRHRLDISLVKRTSHGRFWSVYCIQQMWEMLERYCGRFWRLFKVVPALSAVLNVCLLSVYSRGGKAVRLSYDHKGSDIQEAKRVVEAGGFVMDHRVNGMQRWICGLVQIFLSFVTSGVLAVTRSLGDMAMKDLVISNPFTTETILTDEDKYLILACDGVSLV